MALNGTHQAKPLSRADEVSDLLESVKAIIHPYINAADVAATPKLSGQSRLVAGDVSRTTLTEYHAPQELDHILKLNLPETGVGQQGLLDMIQKIFRYSVNTWDQGFMDKLYSSTNAVGVVSELILAVLNTNVHVYQVSPALTLIEKHTSKALANLFGLTGPRAGGVIQPGGSTSNSSSVIIARNTLFPATKTDGYGDKRFVLFTSAHGHYSLEKAAQMFGFGSNAVWPVPVDDVGRMRPEELQRLVGEARAKGFTPFYVNATAGTTVLGSFDPFDAIADVCKREALWLHVDGGWGGSVVFSERLRKGRLDGVERADSIAINPHKMMGVPMTCSFLLGKDLREFHRANTLPAGYLFHSMDEESEVYDLADLTPQCGRRGDALKMFLGWTYYGRQGYANMIENAFDTAQHFFSLLSAHPHFVLVSKAPLPCLQICFHWARHGILAPEKKLNDRITREIATELITRGWMIDYAPGDNGLFFRVVVGRETRKETVEGLVKAIDAIGAELDLK